MRSIRVVMCLLVMISSSAGAAAEDAEERALLSSVLALVAGVFDGMLSDVPPEHRPALRSIGRDLLVLARREQGRAALLAWPESTERAIEARRQLHAMGLRYWDEQQFQDAVRRGDAIAIELYLAARGLRNPPAGR